MNIRSKEVFFTPQTYRLLQTAEWLEERPRDEIADALLLAALIEKYPQLTEMADELATAQSRLRTEFKKKVEALKTTQP